MELLNIGFVFLLIKITICVLPGVFGIYFIVSSNETKRRMRTYLCSRLFGVRDAIPYSKFQRFLFISGALLLLLSVVASWFILLRGMF
jgi:hypothetical protein